MIDTQLQDKAKLHRMGPFYRRACRSAGDRGGFLAQGTGLRARGKTLFPGSFLYLLHECY